MTLWILSIAPALVVAWIVYTFLHAYVIEKGTFWQRTLAAGKDSATIVVAKLGILVGMLVTALDKLATAAGDPSLIGQVQPYLTPTAVGIGGSVVLALVIWARIRTLGKSA